MAGLLLLLALAFLFSGQFVITVVLALASCFLSLLRAEKMDRKSAQTHSFPPPPPYEGNEGLKQAWEDNQKLKLRDERSPDNYFSPMYDSTHPREDRLQAARARAVRMDRKREQ
jgi:hypothetical protein